MKTLRPLQRLAPFVLGLLCFIAAFQPAHALDPAKAITQYVHSVWRSDEGLPENSVTKILETSDGYLWVGTQGGIARFDGVRFRVFDHTNTPSLHDDWILDLAEDRQGTLWIATSNGGVSSFHNGVFSHLQGIGERAGLAIAADPDGSMWIGGYGGLDHVSNGRVIRHFAAADGLSGDPVRRLVVDKDSTWIATPGGLDRLAHGKVVAYSMKDGLPNNDVIDMHLDSDGALLIQTQNAGLTRLVQGRFEPWSMAGIAGADVSYALRDRDGNLWFASATTGVSRVDGTQVAHYAAKDGLSGDQVKTLYEDRDGNLWVGTTEGGLDRFRDGSFTTYAKEEGLSADQAYAVIEDHNGDIWVTTASGLNQLHGDRVRVFTMADGLPSNSTWALREDHARNLWVGTASGGVFRMTDGHVAQVLSAHEGVPPYVISAILEDRAQQLWISSTGGGLVRYVDNRVVAYSRANGLLTNFLFALAEGAKGTIWIGTSDGLNSITDGHIASDSNASGLAHAAVFTLYFDSRNVLWIGAIGRGLFRFDNGRFTRYTTRQGLPDDSINNILEDASANLWIGSNKGIFRITRHDLDAVADGTSQTVEPIVFGKSDGMKSSETNSATQPSGWRARDGRLWFPTIRGVTVVDPTHLFLSDHPWPARVEQMRADDVDIDLSVPVSLAPSTRRLEIRYTAPNLSAPERTRFRYRLEGFDPNWILGGSQRVAQYTNLAPGHYNFRVGTRAETGNWSTQEAMLDFDLRPQFYQTWWFRLLCGFAGLVAMWVAYRLRVHWLHARAAVLEERQRIASEIHDSLAQGLSGIIFQTEAALMSMTRAPNMTSSHVISARDLAKSSLDDARYSVWNLSPPVLDQKNLLESLSTMARQLAKGRVAELDIHSAGIEWSIRPEARHHIVLVAQEAISNAIQHGNAGTVVVDLTFTADALCLTVMDDGVGFVVDGGGQKPARGYGMRNMRHRAERLGAKLDVTSEMGKGTSISLRVPRLGTWARLWRGLRGTSIARIDG